MFLLCEDDGENSVGPAAGLIHVGGSHSSAGEHIQDTVRKNKTKKNNTDVMHFSENRL